MYVLGQQGSEAPTTGEKKRLAGRKKARQRVRTLRKEKPANRI